MNGKVKIIKNIIALAGLQATNYILPLLLLPYLAKVLGVNGFGIFVVSVSLMQVFFVLTDYGFNLTASRDVAVVADDVDEVAKIFSSVMCLKIIFVGICFLVLILLLCFVDFFGKNARLYLVSYIAVLGNAFFPLWLFQGMEALKAASFIQIFSKTFSFLLVFVFVKSSDDIVLAGFLQGFGGFLSAVLSWFYIPKMLGGGKIKLPGWHYLVIQLKNGWHVFISTAFINLYTSSNAIILGFVSSSTQVAYYHVAEKISRAVQFLFNPVSQAVYPKVSSLAHVNPSGAIEFNRRLIKYGLLCFSILCVFLYGAAPYLVNKFFGSNFLPSVSVLRVMSVLPLLVVVSNVAGILTMLNFGMEKVFSGILMYSCLLNLILFPVLSWRFQALGSAWAVVIVEFFVSGMMLKILKKNGLALFVWKRGVE